MTGEFTEEGLIDEVTGLTPAQMLELERWIKFYDENYVYIGNWFGLVRSLQDLGIDDLVLNKISSSQAESLGIFMMPKESLLKPCMQLLKE